MVIRSPTAGSAFGLVASSSSNWIESVVVRRPSGLTRGVLTRSRPGVGGAAQHAVGGEGPLQPGPRAEMPATRDVLNRTHPQSSTMRVRIHSASAVG